MPKGRFLLAVCRMMALLYLWRNAVHGLLDLTEQTSGSERLGHISSLYDIVRSLYDLSDLTEPFSGTDSSCLMRETPSTARQI